jgi:hypothetical protein
MYERRREEEHSARAMQRTEKKSIGSRATTTKRWSRSI